MNGYIIRAIEFANGRPCEHANEFLESFDPDAEDGRGFGKFTNRISRAMVFESHSQAMKFWQTQSRVRPFRLDGRPNRPLTCLTVSIEPLP